MSIVNAYGQPAKPETSGMPYRLVLAVGRYQGTTVEPRYFFFMVPVPSRWGMVKTATPKRRQNWHGQNGDKSKQRQTKTATAQNSGRSKRRQDLCVVKLLM